MEYIRRELERKFLHMSDFFKAVLVTGARQVGKTTMLKHLCEGQNRTYVTLDNMMARTLAQTDPALFFQTYKPPILIDEVQYAPGLFAQIKILCDENEQTGQFWLTGSQQYKVMKNVRETLAGRVGILTLYGLSQRERDGVLLEIHWTFRFLFTGKAAVYPKKRWASVFEHRREDSAAFSSDSEQRQEYFIPILIPISCATLRSGRHYGLCAF